jgi:hypothetical protein
MLLVDGFFALMALAVAGVFALVVVIVVYAVRKAKRRREEFASWAASQGMTYSRTDPYGLTKLDFHLFGQGDGRGCDNVISGTWQGRDVRIADYWYYERSFDSQGRSSRTTYRFSVVLAAVDASLPPTRIEKENFLSRMADRLAMRDLEFESEEFNRTFEVRGRDREFAYKLIDGRMIEWLLRTAGPHCYEVSGPWAMAYCKQLEPSEVPALLHSVTGFIGQVPRLVWADYGKAGS